ncbi:MAG: ATP synthase F1 subunit epsilon [Elusimicrobia bacterium]|nr:ATP synthase F1 subunit epsilon [Candidatus Liberimonas magnetica]
MARTVPLKIISPQSVIFDQEIISLVCTSEKGKLGVLAGHADMIAGLKASNVEIKDAKGAGVQFAISGGLLEVHPDRVTIYTE